MLQKHVTMRITCVVKEGVPLIRCDSPPESPSGNSRCSLWGLTDPSFFCAPSARFLRSLLLPSRSSSHFDVVLALVSSTEERSCRAVEQAATMKSISLKCCSAHMNASFYTFIDLLIWSFTPLPKQRLRSAGSGQTT